MASFVHEIKRFSFGSSEHFTTFTAIRRAVATVSIESLRFLDEFVSCLLRSGSTADLKSNLGKTHSFPTGFRENLGKNQIFNFPPNL